MHEKLQIHTSVSQNRTHHAVFFGLCHCVLGNLQSSYQLPDGTELVTDDIRTDFFNDIFTDPWINKIGRTIWTADAPASKIQAHLLHNQFHQSQ